MLPCHVDYEQFRGFAIRNESGHDIAVMVNSESAHVKEFILKPMQVYYAYVGDLVAVVATTRGDVAAAKKGGFQEWRHK